MTTFGVEVLVNIVLVLPFAAVAGKVLREQALRPVSSETAQFVERRKANKQQMELFKESAA